MSALSKYKTYPEYKDSGVEWLGEIPSHWEIGRSKNRFQTLKEINRNLQCMDRLSLTMNGVLERSITSDDGLQPSDFSGYQIFNKNDLVFKLIDLENYKTSRVGLVHKKGIMSPAYIRLQTKHNALPKYYYYYYFDLYLRGIYNQLGGQGVRSALNASDLLELPIILIDIQAQTKIAEFLDHETAKIDQLIEKQQSLIELLKEKRQAVISHAVTKGLDPNVKMKDSGVEWLGEVPEHWTVSKIKYHCLVKGRIGFRGYTVNDLVGEGEGALVIGASEMSLSGKLQIEQPKYISWKKYYESPEIMLKKNMVLFVQRGSTVGKVALISEEIDASTINPSLIVLRDININSTFLTYSLLSSHIQSLVNMERSTTAIPMISQEQVGNYWQLLPPHHEQQEIIDFLDIQTSKFDLLTQKAEEQIELMKERRTALISAAVTGKIDVRDWQPEQ